jgi:hypothetical protein
MGAGANEFKYSGSDPASFPTRLELRFRAPVIGCVVVVAMAVATLAVVSATPMEFGWRIALVVAIAAEALWASCAVLRTAGLKLDRAGRIEVTTRDGRTFAGQVRNGSFVAPWFTTVRWQPDGSRFSRTIVVLPDMLFGQDFRHLRVLLRWA